MTPSTQFIGDFLESVSHKAGGYDERFAQHVRERLEVGHREYNGSYRDKSIPQLLREVIEEEADVPTWCALIIDRTYEAEQRGELDPDQAQVIRVCCESWSARSQTLWREMTSLVEEIA